MVIFSTIVGSSLWLFRVFSVQNGSNEILIFSSWCLQFCQKRIVWSSGQFQTPRRGLQWDIASKFQIINVNFILINNKEIPEVQPCLLSSENILQLPNEYLVWQYKWQASLYPLPTIRLSFLQCSAAECMSPWKVEKLKSEDSGWSGGDCTGPCQEKMAFY